VCLCTPGVSVTRPPRVSEVYRGASFEIHGEIVVCELRVCASGDDSSPS
jgi:hypothetical protein